MQFFWKLCQNYHDVKSSSSHSSCFQSKILANFFPSSVHVVFFVHHLPHPDFLEKNLDKNKENIFSVTLFANKLPKYFKIHFIILGLLLPRKFSHRYLNARQAFNSNEFKEFKNLKLLKNSLMCEPTKIPVWFSFRNWYKVFRIILKHFEINFWHFLKKFLY